MIYITGDTHGEHDIDKISYKNWPESRDLTKDDYLVILGDFGFPFFDTDIMAMRGYLREYRYWMHWLSERPYNILFIDGNHDNFNFWDSQPVTQKWGGTVQAHPDIPGAYRLMRGEIYEIDGKKIFTFGGAVSTDIIGRVKDVSWWEQEQATTEQINHALDNLEKHNNKVDYIFTHTMPQKLIKAKGYMPISDRGAEFFDHVMKNVEYKAWCCGHFHVNEIDREHKLHIYYKQIQSLDDCIEEINNVIHTA